MDEDMITIGYAKVSLARLEIGFGVRCAELEGALLMAIGPFEQAAGQPARRNGRGGADPYLRIVLLLLHDLLGAAQRGEPFRHVRQVFLAPEVRYHPRPLRSSS
jgi:hypothetical protein